MPGRATLQTLLDERALRELVTTFSTCLDAKDWAGYARTFTEDGAFEILGQRRVGWEEIAAGPQRDFARYELTQHHTGDHRITVDGDTATLTWGVMAIHMPELTNPSVHSDAGARYDAACARTPAGWRFTHARLEMTWTAGAPFGLG